MTRLASGRSPRRQRLHAPRRPGRRIWRDPHLCRPARRAAPQCPEAKLIARMAAQEQRHLKRFDELMAERRVRPTALQPLWNVAGFGLGAATALMSEKAALACTDAVETEIDRHYVSAARGAWRRRSGAGRRYRRLSGRRARASRYRARGGGDAGIWLSCTDCGNPCRLQGGHRAVEANLRNEWRTQPLLTC